MAIRSKENSLGAWAFLIGVVLALAAGILSFGELSQLMLAVLVILGVIVGFINVSSKDVNTFLMAALSLVIVSFAGLQGIVDAEILNIEIANFIFHGSGNIVFFILF